MCDSCEVPVFAMGLLVTAWDNFKSNPSDYNKFRALDWYINVAVAKWQGYADYRKASGE